MNIEVCDIYSPVHCSIRCSHPSNHCFSAFEKDFTDHYLTVRRIPILLSAPKVGYTGVVFDQGRPYRISIFQVVNDDIMVRLMDYGRKMTYLAGDIYHLVDRFRDFPAQTHEMFITGIIPPCARITWPKEWRENVDTFLKLSDGERIEAMVEFSLRNTLIAEDIVVVAENKIQRSMRNELVEKGLGVRNPAGTVFLRESYANLGKFRLSKS